MGARPEPSLRARALRLLSLREHSRAELTRKLGPHAESPEQLQALLDTLVRDRHLSDERFAESLTRRRGERHGLNRLSRELGEHRLAPELRTRALAQAAASERDVALRVWQRKFGQAPANLQERARQHRFLAARGFTVSTIAWVLKGAAHDAAGAAGRPAADPADPDQDAWDDPDCAP